VAPPRGTFGTYVVIDPRALQTLLESTNGPVVRDLLRRGARVKARAQTLVGVYEPPPDPQLRRPRRPGTLRDSIVVRLARGGRWGVAAIVGSDDPIDMDEVRAALSSRGGVEVGLTGEELARFIDDARPLTDDFAPVDQMLSGL